MLLIIDNYDSFTYNLVHYCQQLGQDVVVKENDVITIAGVRALAPDHILISPGPCTPNQAGISLQVIAHFVGKIPILGVCLGHQCIAQYFGAKIIRAPQPVHGKNSLVYHNQQGVFCDMPDALSVTRYHSLIIDPGTLPDCLNVTAWTMHAKQKIIMGIRHANLAIEGVQFHPEAHLTEHGLRLLRNFFSAGVVGEALKQQDSPAVISN